MGRGFAIRFLGEALNLIEFIPDIGQRQKAVTEAIEMLQ